MKINKTDISISYTINGYRFDRSNVKTLDISELDVSNANNLSMLFLGFRSIKSLDVSKLNTSKVTDMGSMFEFCSKLTSLDLSSFNTSAVTNMSKMFDKCNSLTDLKFGKNLKKSIYLSDCPLTHESALSVINGLAKVEEQQELTLSKTTYKLLTAEDIRQVEAKNWKINAVSI